MTADNFHNVLRLNAERRPFNPYTVELAGGRRVEVDHPYALVERDGVAAFIAPGGIPIRFDHDSVVAIISDTASNSA